MGNAENKKLFIVELFRYYKPTLTKEYQVLLLNDWIDSCVEKEEYEMASALEGELRIVESSPEQPVDSSLKVVPINEIFDKSTKKPENTPILPEKPVKSPKNPQKKGKKWVFIDIWDLPHGFIVVDLQFSFKKKYFKLILLNYGVGYNI